MQNSDLKINLASFLIVAFSIIIFLIGCIILYPYIPDDSYISFRYSENLANGFGLTFNPTDKPVEAYSK